MPSSSTRVKRAAGVPNHKLCVCQLSKYTWLVSLRPFISPLQLVPFARIAYRTSFRYLVYCELMHHVGNLSSSSAFARCLLQQTSHIIPRWLIVGSSLFRYRELEVVCRHYRIHLVWLPRITATEFSRPRVSFKNSLLASRSWCSWRRIRLR